MRILFALTLALSLQTANAQENDNPLQKIELNAWKYYCQNELDGMDNAVFCDCVLAKQFEVNDPRIVKGSLLQLVDDDQNASDADNQMAQDALTEIYNGDDMGADTDMQDFNSSLSGSINTCTAKP